MAGVRTIVAVVVAASALAAAELAGACSCAPSPERERLEAADAAFVGVLAEHRSEPGGAQVRVYRVERAVKGALGGTVEVRTPGITSCELGTQPGTRLALYLRMADGAYTAVACNETSPEALLRAAGPPTAYVVAGRFPRPRLLAYDARGREVARAPAPATRAVLAACRGGDVVAEASAAGVRLRDAATLRVLRVVDDLPPGRVAALHCGEPLRDGATAYLLDRAGRVVRAEGRASVRLDRLGRGVRRVAVAPGGEAVAVLAGDRVRVLDARGRVLSAPAPRRARTLLFTSGSRLRVVGPHGGRAYVVGRRLRPASALPSASGAEAAAPRGLVRVSGRRLVVGRRPLATLPGRRVDALAALPRVAAARAAATSASSAACDPPRS